MWTPHTGRPHIEQVVVVGARQTWHIPGIATVRTSDYERSSPTVVVRSANALCL